MIYEVLAKTPKGPHPYKLVGHANIDFKSSSRVYVSTPAKLSKAIASDVPLDSSYRYSAVRSNNVLLQLNHDRVYITEGKPSWLRHFKWYRPISMPKEALTV